MLQSGYEICESLTNVLTYCPCSCDGRMPRELESADYLKPLRHIRKISPMTSSRIEPLPYFYVSHLDDFAESMTRRHSMSLNH
jgi:hypothetical protein